MAPSIPFLGQDTVAPTKYFISPQAAEKLGLAVSTVQPWSSLDFRGSGGDGMELPCLGQGLQVGVMGEN